MLKINHGLGPGDPAKQGCEAGSTAKNSCVERFSAIEFYTIQRPENPSTQRGTRVFKTEDAFRKEDMGPDWSTLFDPYIHAYVVV